jgi:hypothetical protein
MPTQNVANRQANGPRRRLVPKSKIQLLRALTQSKEIIRVAVPNANRQKYYNLVNSIKKFSRATNNTPKQNLNKKAKNIFNAYSKLPGQSGLGYTQKLEILRHFRELIAIYSRAHANALQEGALLSGTSGIPIVGRVLRSVARTMVR